MAVSEPSRSRDLDKLLLRPGHIIGPNFEPGPELREAIKESVKVLVVGAGGLGCELLKDLALTGFRTLMLEDVGKPKAEVAAKRVMERVNGVNITPHFCRIEDKPLDFYSDFNIIVLGLDSIEARSYINGVACGFLEYDSDDNPRDETVKPMVDGGTEGFKGHARIILPGTTPCFECTIWLFPPQVKFPLCTLAETPRTAAHCIEYAHLIKWDEVHSGKSFDPDNPEDMQWVYSEAVKRAELFGIPGVTYSLTQFIDQLEDHPRLLLTRVSVSHRGKNLYMQAPPVLEEMTRSNLDLPLFDLMGGISKDIVHVNGMAAKVTRSNLV
ncbi:hypothetical protein DH2020_027197 [Rehmannia glutinosa]|uniref:NEDD8-activating enzyme E1 catalytic subunit n=1 Tax=Rehmannia glutinosa TaxID=99300 RepID=A0ABR0VWM8_REHGL